MKLLRARQDAGFNVCVGLDSDTYHKSFPLTALVEDTMETIANFNRGIIKSVGDIASCIKINTAFYEQHGDDGIRALQYTVYLIRELYPDVPVIADGKRGDIDNTNNGYVRFIFDYLGADGITVPPYMGRISLAPFLDKTEKGIFVLVRTSNKGAGEFQDMPVETDWAPDGTLPLYQLVASHVAKDWNGNLNCGVVVGATVPQELAKVRQIIGPDMQMLIPGVGAQGGELEAAITAQGGSKRYIINLSRSVIFASSGGDYPEAARAEVLRINDAIRKVS